MTDQELLYMLRNNVGVSVAACRAAKEAADRIEQLAATCEELVKERDELGRKLNTAVGTLRCLEIAATGAGVPHPQERKLLHEQIALTRTTLAELEGK